MKRDALTLGGLPKKIASGAELNSVQTKKRTDIALLSVTKRINQSSTHNPISGKGIRMKKEKWIIRRHTDRSLTIYPPMGKSIYMGFWTTLCLPGGAVTADKATDKQIMEALKTDEHIYTGERSFPELQD